MLLATLFIFLVLILFVPLIGLWDMILQRYIEKCDKCGKRGKISHVALCHSDDIPAGKTVNDATMKICPSCRL